MSNNNNVTNLDVLSVGALYVGGKRFRDIIRSLIAEDTLEQAEIDQLRTLLFHLKTDGLTSEWIVNNDNRNAVLKTAITAIETKLANIDTTALTETSVLNNDNRNSVLKTRLDTAATDITALAARVTTAEGDIDGVETKTRFITEASITGTGDNTTSTYRTRVGPTVEEKGSTLVELNMKNGPANELIGYTIKSNFNNNDYALNESIYSHRNGRLTLLAETMRLQAAQQIRIGNFAEYGDGFSNMAINIGGRGNKINIGRIDSQNSTGDLTEINIGYLGGVGGRNTNTSIDGNVYLAGARFADLTKSTAFTIASLAALYSSGAPSWVLGFFSGASSLPYSDVWCMKGGFLANKDGDVETSNSIMVKELYVVNKDILAITPKVGFFLAKADYTSTQLIGNHRTQVFEGELVMRNNNITSTNINWALTGANDACNVVNIGGNSGILIHQGASDVGAPLRIYNTRSGSIDFGLGTGGTQASVGGGLISPDGMSIRSIPLTNTNGNAYTGSMVRVGLYYGGNAQTNPFFGTYQMEINQYPGREGMIVAKVNIPETGPQTFKNTIINGDSISTQGTITGIDLVGSTSISAPTATATSLVFNGNYTGDTTNRLYKNADGKLFWNGTELGANLGGGGGGLEYYIPLANNVTNPAPNPTTQFATETYTSAPQRTITQSTTAVNTGILMAKYATDIINKQSNPFVEGLQTIQQHLTWSENNTIGQIYGQTWFQASTSDIGTFIYDRSFTGVAITNGYQVLNGAPILAPQGLFNLTFEAVTFPGIKVDTFNGLSITMKCRLEAQDFITENWTTLQTSFSSRTYTQDNQENQTITFNESFTHNQTSKINAPTAYRMVLFLTTPSANGQIHQQTFAGSTGNDLIAYKLGSSGSIAAIRVLLYDGVNAKQTITHTITHSLVPIELPISPPYQIGAFNFGRLGFDMYMFQPSGAVNANHQMTFYFGDGTISHIETTINEPPEPIPTLAQVLNSGATASQAINMNSNKISGITTLEGAANGNWNVKEITAGTGVSVTPTNGSYAIANTGVLSVAAASGTPGITATTNNGAVTLQNTGVLSVAAASGTPGISVSTTSGAVTLQNTGILSITPGTGISVNTTNGVATITNTAASGPTSGSVLQNIRDDHQSLYEVGALPRKPDYWATNWSVADTAVRRHQDIYVSVDGKVIATATGLGNTGIRYSTNYGTTWGDGNVFSTNLVWSSICGTSTGSRLFAFGRDGTVGTGFVLLLYTSYNQGATWTQITSSVFAFQNAAGIHTINRVRCSGDGTYILANISNVGTQGRSLFSSDGGATWTVKNINSSLGTGFTNGVAMSRSGAVQFITWINDTGNNSKVFRSIDYGATWTEQFGHIAGANWTHIECDATGRYVWATRFDTINNLNPAAWYSDNYGVAWYQAIGWSSLEDVWVSATGQFVVGVSVPNPSASNNAYLVYSTDYGRNLTYQSVGANTYRTINGSADGSVLVLGSSNETEGSPSYTGDGRIRIAREGQQNIQDLQVTGGTFSKANGIYSLIVPSAAEELWYTGITNATTDVNSIFLDDFSVVKGKINLNQYNIRYEIDINWNYTSVGYPYTYITLGMNSVDALAVTDKTQNNAQTVWTNLIQPTYTSAQEVDQVYTNRFFCGYGGGQGTGLAYRFRTSLGGTISLHTRTNQQFSNDIAMNSRLIKNDFRADNFVLESINTNQLRLYGPVGGPNSDAAQQRTRGTALWDATYGNLWNLGSSGGSDLNSGVSRLYIYFTTETLTNRFRGAEVKYSIYRVNKGVAGSV
jgi:hypothetical protein